MSNLTREPPLPVESIGEVFAIAHAMGHEAATRYARIAHRMRLAGKPSLADLFDRLAGDERSHIEILSDWSQKESGRAPDSALVRWKIPETFDDEEIGTSDPDLVSAYRSLSMAVRNEERAFALWTYVIAHAQDPVVRRVAEAMASEELRHVARLRRERRSAYHADRPVESGQPGSMHDLSALERRLADQLDAIAALAGPSNAPAVRQFAIEARATADELTRRPLPVPRRGVQEPVPEGAAALLELLVDRYLEAAEGPADEEAKLHAQALAGRAINRLAWLRRELPARHL